MKKIEITIEQIYVEVLMKIIRLFDEEKEIK